VQQPDGDYARVKGRGEPVNLHQELIRVLA
jgi:hypothetical protein